MQRDGKTWQVSDARLAFGGARVTLDGKCATRSMRSGRSVRPRSTVCCRTPAGSIEFQGSASGALKSPHVVAKLHGENLRYEGWLAQQLDIDADVDAAAAIRRA